MLITDKGCKPKSCSHCKYHYSGKRYFYKMKGVDHSDMTGFICTAFSDEEGIMIHMDGLINDTVDYCEMFTERGTK